MPAFRASTRNVGLEGVLCIVVVAQHPTADAQDHRPVTADDGLEGRLVAAGDEPLQQLDIREAPQRPRLEEGTKVMLSCSPGLHVDAPMLETSKTSTSSERSGYRAAPGACAGGSSSDRGSS